MQPAKSRVLIYPALKVQPASMALAMAELEKIPPTSVRGGRGWVRLAGLVGVVIGALIIPGYIVAISLGYQPLEPLQGKILMIMPPSSEKPATPLPPPSADPAPAKP
jgi:hypothetical protein